MNNPITHKIGETGQRECSNDQCDTADDSKCRVCGRPLSEDEESRGVCNLDNVSL
jgi:hypothetical protein